MLYGVGLFALGLATAGPVWSLEPTQSTGPGVHQGEDGSMSTKQGGNTGPTTGRNEDSGSATGAVRDPTKAEPPHDKNLGSKQPGSDSSHEAGQTKGRKPSSSSKNK
jgi:hypothetical protein